MQKVTSLIDINAPCQDVFNTVVNLERRMQLSPLWGLSQVLEVGPNFPSPGSRYRVRVLTDKPFGLAHGTLNGTQIALSGLAQALFFKLGHTGSNHVQQAEPNVSEQPEAHTEQKPQVSVPVEQEYVVGEYKPPYKFSYYLNKGCKTIVTWKFRVFPLAHV